MKKQNAKINLHREPRKRHTAKRKKPPQRRYIKNDKPSIRRTLQPQGDKTTMNNQQQEQEASKERTIKASLLARSTLETNQQYN
jgi:hypothetical protein